MGVFGWLRGLFGSKPQAVGVPAPSRIASAAERSAEVRGRFWAALGPASDRILSSAPAGSLWPGGMRPIA